METNEQGRSARKRQAIMEAATGVFMEKGYSGTSMDDIAKLAAVSKQTVYKHFSDKEKLFSEIVLATTDRLDGMIALVADVPSDADALDENLTRLARQFFAALTQPQVLQLRRLVIANADAFPHSAPPGTSRASNESWRPWLPRSSAWPRTACSGSTNRSWPPITSPAC